MTENYYKTRRRNYTTTLVLPSSIVDNAQSLELKTYLVSQIAKAAALYRFNEIVIVSCDKKSKMANMTADVSTTEFFVQNLEYSETPQYLRKALFPKSPALRFAGLMNPLDTPHHKRYSEWFPYREGVVINRPSGKGKGSWVNIGINKDCMIDMCLQEGTRVTVKLDQTEFSDKLKYYSGSVVSQDEPSLKLGEYWGY
jgi:methyltransferase